jgi:hypothetical protein
VDTIAYYAWLDGGIRLTMRCEKSNGANLQPRPMTGDDWEIDDVGVPGTVVAIQAPGDNPATVILANKLAHAFHVGHVSWILATPTEPSIR